MFESLEDPRCEGRNKRHDLVDIIFITLCATIAGCDCWTEVAQFARERMGWFRKFIPLKNGVPSHDTIGLDPAVDIKFVEKLDRLVALDEIKATSSLKQMVLVNNSRLSVQPVKKKEFDTILKMAKTI